MIKLYDGKILFPLLLLSRFLLQVISIVSSSTNVSEYVITYKYFSSGALSMKIFIMLYFSNGGRAQYKSCLLPMPVNLIVRLESVFCTLIYIFVWVINTINNKKNSFRVESFGWYVQKPNLSMCRSPRSMSISHYGHSPTFNTRTYVMT